MQSRLETIRWDVVAGGAMIAVAVVFLGIGAQLTFGSLTRMGPGFLPVCAAIGLAALGGVIVIEGLKGTSAVPDFPKLRPFLVVIACPIVFSMMIEWAGMVPTVLVTAVIARMAEPVKWGWDLVLVPVGLAAMGVFIFIDFLGVAIPAF
ncbi:MULTISPECIES: tripartite tricarboxylate transporter TctB family protein [Rhizobium/Agrobacterium group]|uniref:tripartite tricarboxylate transporter TctB family protein n=1 Tax=Rhizobium/Agrobacterium group TaxID=227290 RepID=UPI0009EADD84|nr:tripartite tricarboxylate transporter TctB family protein [Rhizobium sp. Root483D2]